MNKKNFYEALYAKDEDKIYSVFQQDAQIVIDNIEHIIMYRHNKVLKEILKNHQFKQQEINRLLCLAYNYNNNTSLNHLYDYWKEDSSKKSFLEHFLISGNFTSDEIIMSKTNNITISEERITKYEKLLAKRIKDKKNKWYLQDLAKWEAQFNQIKIKNLANKLDGDLKKNVINVKSNKI